MQEEKPNGEGIRILVAAVCPESGPGGIGVVAINAPTIAGSRVYEQAEGTAESLHYRSVIRGLELARRLRAKKVLVACADEATVKQINQEMPVPQRGRLPLLYIKSRALMHMFTEARIVFVPRRVVAPALKLALAASRIPVRKPPRDLFTISETTDDQELINQKE